MSKGKNKIAIIGHFAEEKKLLNGQTVKTKIIANELKKRYGEEDITIIDTHGGLLKFFKIIMRSFFSVYGHRDVIMMPAENGLKVIAPVVFLANLFCRSRLHYIVIGGWLGDYIVNKKILSFILRRFSYIYVETEGMKTALEKQNFRNIVILRNSKNLKILTSNELVYHENPPFRICTFSRVMKEKGIEDIVNAIIYINEAHDNQLFELDIFGQVEPSQNEWFEELKMNFPSNVKYRGSIDYDASTQVLKDYFALVFPTYYEGEGLAGTLIDAMAAGVPVIASDWKYNSEVIKKEKNGIIYPVRDNTQLVNHLLWITRNVNEWNRLKENAINEASNYLPENALIPLFYQLRR